MIAGNRQPFPAKRAATNFVLTVGILSLFADFTYEGARSILGPYLATFGLGAFAIGVIAGFGQFLNYAVRLFSGRMADVSGRFWPIAIFGYVVQMLSVPALALASGWPMAAGLAIVERFGKAVRNPPRDAMLSHAAETIGFGWTFGMHEALDKAGATIGPLAVAGVMAWQGDYRIAFACLLLPALVNLSLVGLARRLYPNPETLARPKPAADESARETTSPAFRVYLAAAMLVAAGFADFPIIAYAYEKTASVPTDAIPLLYALAMAMAGLGSFALGRLFDRFGFRVLIVLTVATAFYAPLVFAGGLWTALAGAVLWGLGMGVHESIIPAAVGPMVPQGRRASSFGLFTALYGLAWFAGSAVTGLLYDQSAIAATLFCVLIELAAVPLLLAASRRARRRAP